MEKLISELGTQLQFLRFTNGKSKGIVEKENVEGIERHRDALRAIVKTVETLKVQIEQAKFESGATPEEVAEWSSEIEEQQAVVDQQITFLSERSAELSLRTTIQAKKLEEDLLEQARTKQLEFERAQLQLKLDYEKKMEETRKGNKGVTEQSSSQMKTAKLPKLVITNFRGQLTDWTRFWNQFEAEIDGTGIPAVTKFSYLKELVDPKIRTEIDGLPFSSEGYERAKNILKTKYGKTSEVVNAYVENIMALPTINGNQPARIHEFYDKLLFNVQSLETMGKLKEINGYVRMTLDKLGGIRGDLVRTDDSWREWNFPKFVEELRKWTERNPVPVKPPERQLDRVKDKSHPRDRSYQTQQKEERTRGCVYCDKPEHRSVDCQTVTSLDARKRLLSSKRLCFSCTGNKHRAADCKSRSLCQICQKRHHTSICDRLGDQLMTATLVGKSAVIYPVVVVEVKGVKCRALLDTGAGSSYASAALIDRLSLRPHQREVRQIEMMLGAVTKPVEIYKVQIQSLNGDFSLDTEVTNSG